MTLHPVAAQGFGAAARDYAQARPEYPPEAAACLRRALHLGEGARVLDLGAGTGHSAGLFRGARVVAAEPVRPMLRELRVRVPEVPAVRAVARPMPFRSGAFDVVLCAQSFHWFASAETLEEIARVLVDGGGLALVWNIRQRHAPWSELACDILDALAEGAPRWGDGAWQRAFEAAHGWAPLEHREFANAQVGSRAFILRRIASVSYVAARPPGERERILRRIAQALPREELIVWPHRTHVYWTRRVRRHPCGA
jgi:SAM-dependent methyltransferase